MNKIKIFLLIFIGIIVFNACEDDKDKVVFNDENSVPPIIQSPVTGSSFTLTFAEGESNFEPFKWIHADYGAYISRTYFLQLDMAGNNFSAPIVLGETSQNEFTISKALMNAHAFDFGGGSSVDFEFRILATGTNELVDTIFSEPIAFTVTPFEYPKPDITSPADGSTFVLEKDTTGTVDFDKIVWNAVNYGSTEIMATYVLEFDKADSNFVKPVRITSTSGTSYTGKVANINKLLLSRGLVAEQATDLDFRVVSSIGGTSGVVYSDIITYTFTPYPAEVGPGEPAKLWVPGDYQGWSPGTAPNIWDNENDGTYFGHVYFPETAPSFNFKFTSAPDWDHTNFGDGGSEGVLDTDPGAGNISVPEFGCYRFNVDTINLTWTYLKVDWGVIGSATPNGWDSDVDMTWDETEELFTVTVDLVVGEIKFRANDAWDIAYGIDEDGNLDETPGSPNIPIDEAGNYTVKLILSGATPTYSLTKN